MNRKYFLLILIFVVLVTFKSYAHAAEGNVFYRCSSVPITTKPGDPSVKWEVLTGQPMCTTNAFSNNKAYIYIQFKKENPVKYTPVYTILFTYKAPVGAATATPAPTTAAGGATATPIPPTPTPTPADAKTSSTNRCPNLGTDTVLDVVQDCQLNSADGAKILKGIREHGGQ